MSLARVRGNPRGKFFCRGDGYGYGEPKGAIPNTDTGPDAVAAAAHLVVVGCARFPCCGLRVAAWQVGATRLDSLVWAPCVSTVCTPMTCTVVHSQVQNLPSFLTEQFKTSLTHAVVYQHSVDTTFVMQADTSVPRRQAPPSGL
jgi:hypothetical protein